MEIILDLDLPRVERRSLELATMQGWAQSRFCIAEGLETSMPHLAFERRHRDRIGKPLRACDAMSARNRKLYLHTRKRYASVGVTICNFVCYSDSRGLTLYIIKCNQSEGYLRSRKKESTKMKSHIFTSNFIVRSSLSVSSRSSKGPFPHPNCKLCEDKYKENL